MFLFSFVLYLIRKDMDSRKIEKISKALGDPSRIAILQELKKKKDCLYCTEVHEILDLAQPSVSHHLKQLVDADILIPEKEGRNLKYALNDAIIDEYISWLEALKG